MSTQDHPVRIPSSPSDAEKRGLVAVTAERQCRQLQLIGELSDTLGVSRRPNELLHEVVRLIQASFGSYYVHIHLVNEPDKLASCAAGWGPSGITHAGTSLRLRYDGLIGWVAWSGQSMLVSDVRTEPRYLFSQHFPLTRSELTVPLKLGDHTIGALDLQDVRENAFDQHDLDLLLIVARQTAVALEAARLAEKLAESELAFSREMDELLHLVEQAADARAADRQRIGMALHDSVIQLLVGARFELASLTAASPSLSDTMLERIDTACSVLDECQSEVRRVMFDLSPPELQDLGLIGAIRRHAELLRRLGYRCTVRTLGEQCRLSPTADLRVLRIVQEAMTNAWKHARNASAEVVLRFGSDNLQVAVRDTGPGFNPNAQQTRGGSYGLMSMRQNARQIGADLRVGSRRGHGTEVTLSVPLVPGTWTDAEDCSRSHA